MDYFTMKDGRKMAMVTETGEKITFVIETGEAVDYETDFIKIGDEDIIRPLNRGPVLDTWINHAKEVGKKLQRIGEALQRCQCAHPTTTKNSTYSQTRTRSREHRSRPSVGVTSHDSGGSGGDDDSGGSDSSESDSSDNPPAKPYRSHLNPFKKQLNSLSLAKATPRLLLHGLSEGRCLA